MREEARAGQHIRQEVADEIGFSEMPGIPTLQQRTRSLGEDKAYWTGVRNAMMLLINYGTTVDKVLSLHRTSILELGKIDRIKDGGS